MSGAEVTAVTIAAHVMPLKDFNDLLDGLLKVVEGEHGSNRYRVRLIVSGGEMDEPEFVKAIEDQGGLVVYEDTCFGARYYEEPVSREGDPLTRIAERYFYRLPCARIIPIRSMAEQSSPTNWSSRNTYASTSTTPEVRG